MKIIIDISEEYYNDIQSRDWKNTIWADEVTRAIHEGTVLPEHHGCEDEYIKVPKKALKYRTAGMVAYNAEWLKNHFDIERAVICGAQEPILDKIRAEIEKPLRDERCFDTADAKAQYIALNWCIEIIDKYKAESEDKE